MPNAANLNDSQILSTLRVELDRLGAETSACLEEVEWEIKRQLQWLEERGQYWRKEVSRYQKEANNARVNLYRCESSRMDNDDRFGPSSCEGERKALKWAEENCSNAQRELNNVNHWQQVVSQGCAAYRAQAQSFRSTIEIVIPKGKALLTSKEQAIQKYAAIEGSGDSSDSSSVNNHLKGRDFEQWARDHVFKGNARRLHVLIADNTHLDKFGDGIGLTKDRSSDAFVDEDGSIWELKAGYQSGGIDKNQRDEYSYMEQAGHVYIRDGGELSKVNITSINYLFESEKGAIANATDLTGLANVWFVDPDGIVRLFS